MSGLRGFAGTPAGSRTGAQPAHRASRRPRSLQTPQPADAPLETSSGSLFALGVDAGGTKTDAVVCDTTGVVRGFGTSGRGNWEYDGLELATASLRGGCGRRRSRGRGSPPRPARLVGVRARGTRLADGQRPARARGGRLRVSADPYELVNDAFAALRAGCRADYGAVSIAGTGSVTAARNREGARRSARWRSATASAVAASDLVGEALDAIARTRHGQAPPTLLEERYLAALGFATSDELFESISRHDLERVVAARAARARHAPPTAIALRSRSRTRWARARGTRSSGSHACSACRTTSSRSRAPVACTRRAARHSRRRSSPRSGRAARGDPGDARGPARHRCGHARPRAARRRRRRLHDRLLAGIASAPAR